MVTPSNFLVEILKTHDCHIAREYGVLLTAH